MILFLRKKIHSNWYKIVIWMTFASMALIAGLPSLFRSRDRSPEVVAWINGTPVYTKALMRSAEAQRERIALTRQQFQQMGLPVDPMLFNVNPQQIAFNTLVENQLLDTLVNSLGIRVPEEFVVSKLQDPYFLMSELTEFVPAHLAIQGLSGESLDRILRSRGVTIPEFEQTVEADLERSLLKTIIAHAAYVPSFELKNAYQQLHAAKKFSTLILPFDQALKKEKARNASLQELELFYNEHKQEYVVPEKRDAIVWEFSYTQYDLPISSAQIKAYYDEHKNSFIQTPAQVIVREIVTDTPEKAEALKQENLVNPELFTQKGKLRTISRIHQASNIEQVAFKLKQDGEVSPITQVDNGFAILKRIERKKAIYKPLSSVEKEIRLALEKQEFRKQFAEDVERTYNSPAELQALIEQKHAKKLVHTNVAKADSLLSSKLFSLKRNGSTTHYRENDHGYVVQLTQVRTSYVPALSAVKSRVEADLHAAKAYQSWVASIDEAAKLAQKGSSFKDIALQFGGQVKEIDWIEPDQEERIKSLSKELPVEQMLQLEKQGSIVAFPGQEKAYLVRLEGIKPLNEQEFNTKKSLLSNSILQKESYAELTSFIASLRRAATLELNENAMKTTEYES